MKKVKYHSKALNEDRQTERIVGRYTQGKKGPLLIFTTAVHGNEVSGVVAAQNVLAELKEDQPDIKGEVIAIACNLKALHKGKRLIERDMNRICNFMNVEELKKSDVYKTSEGKELKEVMEIVEEELEREDITQVYFVDIHTTSSESLPFISAHEFPHSAIFAENFPVYTVTGLGVTIPGTIDDYLNRKGCIGFTFEAGQHDDLSSIESNEALMWITITHAGLIETEELPCYPHCEQILRKTVVEGKVVFDVKYRHGVKPEDEFQMNPGYVNFQKIHKGEELARDKKGVIKSKMDGRVLMPLYQKEGEDGFFIVQEVKIEEMARH